MLLVNIFACMFTLSCGNVCLMYFVLENTDFIILKKGNIQLPLIRNYKNR